MRFTVDSMIGLLSTAFVFIPARWAAAETADMRKDATVPLTQGTSTNFHAINRMDAGAIAMTDEELANVEGGQLAVYSNMGAVWTAIGNSLDLFIRQNFQQKGYDCHCSYVTGVRG